MLAEVKLYMQVASVEGVNAASQEIRTIQKSVVTLPRIKVSLSMMEEEARKSLQKTLKDIRKKVKDEEDEKKIKAIFESMEYRIRFKFVRAYDLFLIWTKIS